MQRAYQTHYSYQFSDDIQAHFPVRKLKKINKISPNLSPKVQ